MKFLIDLDLEKTENEISNYVPTSSDKHTLTYLYKQQFFVQFFNSF